MESPQNNVVIHKGEEGGFWAEILSLPGCVTEGESVPELLNNLRDAAWAWCETAKKLRRESQQDEEWIVVYMSVIAEIVQLERDHGSSYSSSTTADISTKVYPV